MCAALYYYVWACMLRYIGLIEACAQYTAHVFWQFSGIFYLNKNFNDKNAVRLPIAIIIIILLQVTIDYSMYPAFSIFFGN
jgi:hypothetical protein